MLCNNLRENVCAHCFSAAVITSTGDVCVNTGYRTRQHIQLECTAQGALWSVSGFGKGLEDQTRVSAVSLAGSSTRVTTYDTSNLTNSSGVTISDFTYDDYGAIVTCESLLPGNRKSVTMIVGKFE